MEGSHAKKLVDQGNNPMGQSGKISVFKKLVNPNDDLNQLKMREFGFPAYMEEKSVKFPSIAQDKSAFIQNP